jgi:hypothetical protein
LTNDWDKEWRDVYRKAIEDAIAPYKERLTNSNVLGSSLVSTRLTSTLDVMLDGDDELGVETDELKQYLDSGMYK